MVVNDFSSLFTYITLFDYVEICYIKINRTLSFSSIYNNMGLEDALKSQISINLRIEQKLTLTPELKQSIQILQFSNYELSQYIQEQLTDNPLLDMDWSHEFTSRSKIKSTDHFTDKLVKIESPGETLQEYCMSQMRLIHLDSSYMNSAEYLIGNLNDDGYLAISLEEAQKQLSVPLLILEEALKVVQSLEPVGVAARNLQECLLLQIERASDAPTLAKEIVLHHLELLSMRKLDIIGHALKLSVEDVDRIFQYIRTLNPRPGLQIGDAGFSYIIPDASIKMKDNQLMVQMNESMIPKITINEEYRRLMQQTDQIDPKQFLDEKWRAGLSLIRSIDQRKQTLFRVIKAIIEQQPQFIEKGLRELKPLTLNVIAEKLQLHESTISRTVQNKYIETPHGIMELRAFFTTGIQNHDGDQVSTAEIKVKIKQLIAVENHKKPLSDQQIVKQLYEENIRISRRTVTKYREELRILSSTYRKNM